MNLYVEMRFWQQLANDEMHPLAWFNYKTALEALWSLPLSERKLLIQDVVK